MNYIIIYFGIGLIFAFPIILSELQKDFDYYDYSIKTEKILAFFFFYPIILIVQSVKGLIKEVCK